MTYRFIKIINSLISVTKDSTLFKAKIIDIVALNNKAA
jgi:hypothetical protein